MVTWILAATILGSVVLGIIAFVIWGLPHAMVIRAIYLAAIVFSFFGTIDEKLA